MKRTLVALTAVALVVGLVAPSVAQENQGRPRGRGNRGQRGGFGQGFPGQFGGRNFPGGQFGGRQGFPGAPGRGGMFGGQNTMVRVQDPKQSAIMTLLQRDDVRNELLITSRQREQIEGISASAQQEFIQSLRQSNAAQPGQRRQRGQNGRGGEQGNAQGEQNTEQSGQAGEQNGQNGQGGNQNAPGGARNGRDRRQQLEQMQQQFATTVDKKVAEILTPKQIARLHEIDLQWRGPLALGDPRSGEELKLSAEQQTKIEELLNEYRTKQQEIMQETRQSMMSLYQNRTPNTPFTQQEQNALTDKTTAARTQIDRHLKTLGDRALVLLTPDQQAYWKQMQGRAFTFRPAP